MDTGTDRRDRSAIQKAAFLFGVVFLVVGVAGFIPGITTEYDRLSNFDGEGALLLGVFGINWLESVVHLLYGAAGLASASSPAASRTYFVFGGAVYILLWIYGLVIDLDTSANFIGINVCELAALRARRRDGGDRSGARPGDDLGPNAPRLRTSAARAAPAASVSGVEPVEPQEVVVDLVEDPHPCEARLRCVAAQGLGTHHGSRPG